MSSKAKRNMFRSNNLQNLSAGSSRRGLNILTSTEKTVVILNLTKALTGLVYSREPMYENNYVLYYQQNVCFAENLMAQTPTCDSEY